MKLPETIEDFKKMVWAKSKDHLDQYPLWFQKEFIEYWIRVPDCANKCNYFLLSKKAREKWSTLGRMATCKRIFYRDDPRFNTSLKTIARTLKLQQPPGPNEYIPMKPDYDKYRENNPQPETRGNITRLMKHNQK